MMIRRDVTHEPGSAAAAGLEAEVAALTALGFTLLGRVAIHLDDVHSSATVYREPDATWFIQNAARPSTTLRSPDGGTCVSLSPWFDDTPYLMFRSQLTDGAVVETRTRVGRGPRRAGKGPPHDDTLGAAPGRLIQIAEGTPEAQWASHQARLAAVVAARGASAKSLDLAALHALSDALGAHARLCLDRQQRQTLWVVVVLSLGGLCLGAASVALGLPQAGPAALVWVGVLGFGPGTGAMMYRATRALRLPKPAWVGSETAVPDLRPLLVWALLLAVVLTGAGAVTGAPWWAAGSLALGAALAGVGLGVARLTDEHAAEESAEANARAAWGLDPDPGLLQALQAGDLEALLGAMEASDEPIELLSELSEHLPESVLQAWSASDDPRGELALGWAHIRWAWRARGSGWAERVSAGGRADFAEHLSAAEQAFAAAAARGVYPADAWAGVVMARRVAPIRDAWTAFSQVVAHDPLHRMGHVAIMERVKPKWGGSEAMMFDLARRAPPELAWLVVEAHLEVWAQEEEGSPEPSHLTKPEVRVEVEEAWVRFREGGRPDKHGVNLFAAGLYLLGSPKLAREAVERVGLELTEDPWCRWGEPIQAYLDARAALELPEP